MKYNLLSLKKYAKSLENQTIFASKNQVEKVINAIRSAIYELTNLENDSVDKQIKNQIIQNLKFVIEDIQSGKFTNIEEIKNEVSIITCDLLHKQKKTIPVMENTCLLLSICVNLWDQVDIALHMPGNSNS
ncbi:MAG: hypothetical protein KA717_35295 [Woronichinia naegeliana WA131]|uniref:Uncharacterized protein n=1 Tax=Woronichinia naegeliana WA131 TaxID=2824559 RepID=A0A977KVH8_9CYAN|nr:MAG: hypothetical protein KA717_35295 [Woronichinia naegeliana WA131]